MNRACLAALAVLLLASAVMAQAAPVYHVKAVGHLPSAVYRATSVDTRDAVYLFGGRNESATIAAVVRYDKATGRAAPAGWSLPEPRMSACAVFDGKYAFVFGGANGGNELDTILRIEPGTGDVRTLEARLPSPRIGLSAAIHGGMAYLFGGHSNGTMLSTILRFDPSSGNLSRMGASLPAGLAGAGVAADPQGILLFGGNTGSGGTDRVMRYDPQNDNLTVLSGRLPYPVYHAPALAFCNKIFILGGSAELLGWEVSRATDTIIEFDPVTGKSRTLPERLHSPRERTCAALVDGSILVFGGQEGVRALDEISALDASADGASRGPAIWTIVLSVALLAPVAALALAAGRPR